MPQNIILAPHLDDAVLNCWHLISQPGAIVMNIFSAVPPAGTRAWWDRICGVSDSHRMMQLRLSENQRAMRYTKNQIHQVFVDELDSQYRTKKTAPSIKALADIIEKKSVADGIYFAPLAVSRIYRHPDHVLVRLVNLELRQRGHNVAFYPDYPYMLATRKPNSFLIKRTRALAEKTLAMNLTLRIQHLTNDMLNAKSLAMRSYETQYRAMNIETLGALDRLARRDYELVFYPA